MSEQDSLKSSIPCPERYSLDDLLCPVEPVEHDYDVRYAQQYRDNKRALPISERDPEYLGPLSHDLHASLYMQLPLTYEAARKRSNPALFARSLRLRPELEKLKRGSTT